MLVFLKLLQYAGLPEALEFLHEGGRVNFDNQGAELKTRYPRAGGENLSDGLLPDLAEAAELKTRQQVHLPDVLLKQGAERAYFALRLSVSSFHFSCGA